MNIKQKSKIGNLILFIVYIGLAVGLGYMFILNEKLSAKIERQGEIMRKYNLSDSSLKNDAEKIKDDLDKISSSFTYIKNGKKLSGNALVSFIEKIENERDSINYLYSHAKKVYGFEIITTIKRNKTETSRTISAKSGTRADSADVTYRLYKNRIYRKNGSWYGDATSKKDLDEIEKVINEKLMPKAREILKSQMDTVRSN